MIEHHIILMENDEHRLNHFNTHFSDMIDSNEISIFPAITKNTSNFIDIPKNIDINIDKKFRKIATVGQIGCALSHITLWQYLLQKDTSMAIVLEDDAIMSDDYRNELQSIIDELPKNWDFVNLFTHPKQSTRKNRYEIPGKVCLLNRIRTWGTVGYLISKSGLQKICKKLEKIGLYAPIDIVLQDFLEDLVVFNLKNDIVSTAGQLTESDTTKNRLKSNVWQSNSYLNLLHSKNKKIRYYPIEPFNIYPKAKHDNSITDFSIDHDNHSLMMNFKQGAPKKGDTLIFEKIMDLPMTFNSSNILSFVVNSSYFNYNVSNFFKYTVSINDEKILYEKVGLYSNNNNISIILNNIQKIKLTVNLETIRDCEDWNWRENIKLTINDIKLESTGKFYDDHLSYSSPHSIDMYSSRKQPLVSLLKELSQQGSIIDVFIPGGNKGDGLIYQGAYTLFARFGIEINTFDKVSQIPNKSDILIILGSGGFSKNYHTMIDIIPKLITNYQMNYIFPSTFDLSFAPVKEFISNIPENVVIFCREKRSYEGVKKLLNSERVFLDHDTAFHLDYTPWIKRSDGSINAFRVDKESSKIVIPEDNIDISSGFHYQWKELLDEIVKYSEINTNRAHVSIAAAKMGKITNIYPSNYFKQEEIYRYSLINFDNVAFMDGD